MILWTTDTHYNFLRVPGGVKMFGKYLADENKDATGLIVSGDIATAKSLTFNLHELADGFGKPIYFILGNHDYYHSSFTEVDKEMGKIINKNLHWLRSKPVVLGDVTIVGVDNWYDGRYGATDSRVALNDWMDIKDLMFMNHPSVLLTKIQARADLMAELLQKDLEKVTTSNVVIVVHVPPYDMSAWHEGHMSEPDWMPWFSSKITGIMIDNFAEKNPDKNA